MLVTIMNLPNVLNAGFDQIFNLYNPLVMETADIIDTWVYRVGLVERQYSLGTAVGLLALDRGNHFDAVSQQNRAKSDRLQDLLGGAE